MLFMSPRQGSLPPESDLRRSREQFLSEDMNRPLRIREEIQASWVRSQHLAVNSDQVDPEYLDSINGETLLAQCAAPILRSLGQELAGEPVSILLTDRAGTVLQRVCHDAALSRTLDAARLAPGFVYAESSVGTNGIGTALEMRAATMVTGAEHFAEDLAVFACAGAPIHHPITGALLGVLDFTCSVPDSNPLLLALVKSAAHRVQDQLLAQASAREVALMRDYLSACYHTGGSVLALSNDLFMMNAHTQKQYDSADQTALLAKISDVVGAMGPLNLVADLPSGATARLDYRPAFADAGFAGGVFRIQSHTTRDLPTAVSKTSTPLPGVVGTSPTWKRVCESVLESQRRDEWLVLEGEKGVGKLALLQGVHQVAHRGGLIRVLDAADVEDTETWLDAVSEELNGDGGTLVLRRVHLLPSEAINGLADLLIECTESEVGASQPWVAMTLCASPRSSEVDSQLLPHFPHTVNVPALRHHMEDLPRLIRDLLSRVGGGNELTVSTAAMNQLMRLPWQGNVEHLRRVLAQVAKQRRTGVIDVKDLPAECHATSRRDLSPLERLESDAIVDALDVNAGNKDRAAQSLGVSRATIYRKIKDYGIF